MNKYDLLYALGYFAGIYPTYKLLLKFFTTDFNSGQRSAGGS